VANGSTPEQRCLEAAGGHRLRAQPVALAQHHRAGGYPEVGTGDEHARDVANGGGLLGLGADHEAGGVGEEEQRQAVGVTELHEAGRLVDHRRAAYPDARVLGGDHDIAAAEQGGIPGEAVAGGDPDERDEAAQLGEPTPLFRRTARRAWCEPTPAGVYGAYFAR
jgi:hypothetical protein